MNILARPIPSPTRFPTSAGRVLGRTRRRDSSLNPCRREPVSFPGMRAVPQELIRRERFESTVVDHLAPTAYFPDLPHAVLFQHNVETVIWRRHVEQRPTRCDEGISNCKPDACIAMSAASVGRRVNLAVSPTDANEMRRLFGVTRVSEIPTGVNIDYFRRPRIRCQGKAPTSSSWARWTGCRTSMEYTTSCARFSR